MVLITQTEVNAVFDEQVRLCADTLQKKTKEYTGDDTDRLGTFKAGCFAARNTPASACRYDGEKEKKDGYLEGGGWLVSWCVGHLMELAQPEAYGEQYACRAIFYKRQRSKEKIR